jgi:ribosome maturation factor RimP
MGNVKETPEPRLRQLIEKDKQQRIDKCVALFNEFKAAIEKEDCEFQPVMTLTTSGVNWGFQFVAK